MATEIMGNICSSIVISALNVDILYVMIVQGDIMGVDENLKCVEVEHTPEAIAKIEEILNDLKKKGIIKDWFDHYGELYGT